jgi:hypothetical protein
MEVHPRQAKIDALLAAIGIGDEAMIISCCKGIQNADFQLIVTKVCLKPIRKDDKSDVNAALVPKPGSGLTASVATTTTAEKRGGPAAVAAATTPAENIESTVEVKSPPSYLSVVGSGFGNKQTKQTKKEDGPAAATTPAVESIVVVKSPPSYLSVVKSGFGNKQTKQITVTPTGKICKKLMDTGACEEKKSCQHLHPVKCSYYASFGLARTNPKGCKSTDCQFLHVVICRFKYKALCKKQLCSLQHLQPKAVEKKAKVQPEEVIHHQPKKAPTTATSTVSFLDQGLDQRMSKIEGLLMMMIQQRGLPPAPSGWPLGTLGEAYSNVSLK